MTIHNLYIFDRSGSCLFYSEWHRRRAPGIPQEERMAPQESPGHPPGGANGTGGEPRASPRRSEWHRRRAPGIPQEEEFKLMFGMLFSLRSFVNKMSPTDMKDGFISFHTSRYRLHYLETPSGLRLALNTDLSVASAREALQHIYSNLFVELVVKNPLCPPRAPVQSVLFRQRLDAFVRSLPYFGPKNPNS